VSPAREPLPPITGGRGPEHIPQAAPLWAPAEDAGIPIQGGIAGASAHLSLDLGHAATLSLHLRVKDGVADVRIEGAGTEHDLFRRREAATALRQEGLTLGNWEVHAAGAPLSHTVGVTTAALELPSNVGTPFAQAPEQAMRATTAAAAEGVRRATGGAAATVVAPPASGRRQAPGNARAGASLREDREDSEEESGQERESVHVTA